MSFQLRHPVGMTTHTFSTSDFLSSESGQRRIEPRIGQRVSDQTIYSYRTAGSVWEYTRALKLASATIMANLEAFFDFVDGEPFDFTDGTCGPSTGWVTVRLAEASFSRDYGYVPGGHPVVTLVLVQQP